MADAEAIAAQLAYEFLRTGRYGASTGPIEIPRHTVVAAAVEDEDVTNYADKVEEFSGLMVQSVGFEQGPDSPAVHLYLTRGAVRHIKALPAEIEGTPIKVHRMGPITVRPEPLRAARIGATSFSATIESVVAVLAVQPLSGRQEHWVLSSP